MYIYIYICDGKGADGRTDGRTPRRRKITVYALIHCITLIDIIHIDYCRKMIEEK